jgi:excinuclease ABC subunit A
MHCRRGVITGLSGSVKSTLAFDTISTEDKLGYIENPSASVRQFLEMMQKPDVEDIDEMGPAIWLSKCPQSPSARGDGPAKM